MKTYGSAVLTALQAQYKSIDEIDKEIKRLQALKKHVDGEQKRVECYLAEACERTGTVSLKGVYANISFKTNPPKTIIDNEALIPEEYITVKVERKPNLTAIKEAIKAGKEVAGTHLEQERKIQIK